MNEIKSTVLGTSGIGRRTLDVSRHKDELTPVAACDRSGFVVDRDSLDDDTSMPPNVNAPALGYLKTAVRRNRAGEYGVFGPAELIPGF